MRVLNRIAAILLALALLGTGVLAIVETILWATGRPPWLFPLESWRDSASRLQLGDNGVLVAGIVLVVVGLGVIALELRPVRPQRLRSTPEPDAATDWWLNRKSVERRAAGAAGAVWGVHDVKTHAAGRPTQWHLSVSGDSPPGDEQSEEVERAVREELARLWAPPDVPVEVSLHHTRRVA